MFADIYRVILKHS